jgi:hypothetical protein
MAEHDHQHPHPGSSDYQPGYFEILEISIGELLVEKQSDRRWRDTQADRGAGFPHASSRCESRRFAPGSIRSFERACWQTAAPLAKSLGSPFIAQSESFNADWGAEFEGDFATLWQTGVLTPLWAAPAAAAAWGSPVAPLTPGRHEGRAAD